VLKNIAIFFLSIYLLGTTPIGQLCKLPLLFEHFQEHQLENKNLSFISFLKMHYFNGDPKDADYDKDMKLPFKTVDFNSSACACVVFENPTFKLDNPRITKLVVKNLSKSKSWHSNSCLNAIWQPPRFV
jgi:hypothetical protein